MRFFLAAEIASASPSSDKRAKSLVETLDDAEVAAAGAGSASSSAKRKMSLSPALVSVPPVGKLAVFWKLPETYNVVCGAPSTMLCVTPGGHAR